MNQLDKNLDNNESNEDKIKSLEEELKKITKEKNALERKLKRTTEVLDRTNELYLSNERVLNKAYADIEEMMTKITSTQAQLEQASKLAVVGEVAGRVAHEILNPLTSILGKVHDLLKIEDLKRRDNPIPIIYEIVNEWNKQYQNGTFEDYLKKMNDNGELCFKQDIQDVMTLLNFIMQKQHPKKKEILEFIEKNIMRVVDIINEMRGLSRDLGQIEEVDINNTIMESIEILRSMLEKNKITLIEKYEPQLPYIKANSTELIQIFSNIIRNAIQAIGNNGSITISTSKAEFMNKERINIRIIDTGSGIKPEHLPRIFESGFTTKSEQDGTGLGLSICKKLARKYGGDIYVEKTAVGEGTTFLVYFPIITKQVIQKKQEGTQLSNEIK